MLVNVFNKAHFPIKVGKYTFKPFEEVILNIGAEYSLFRDMRCQKSLRIGRVDNDKYKKSKGLVTGNKFNFCLDVQNQHAGEAYRHAITALSEPIIKHLPAGEAGIVNRPLLKINCRFFNSHRINQQGKCQVGPRDVFFSHGIGDKNYWIGSKIRDFKYAFVPGPAWKNRMRETGYKGEIFISGYTKLDPLINGEIKKTKREKPYIVWMPTHGYNNKFRGRSSYPQCMQLINEISTTFETKIAMHPTSKMHQQLKHVPTIQELVDADVVIADAGSTLYEAWILDKPVIFPDWICKNDVLGHFKNSQDNFEYQIYKRGIGYHAKDMKHLNKLIETALVDGMKDEEKQFIENIYPSKLRGKAGETAAKYLIELSKILKI
jgi:hypothetical protein